MPLKRKPVVLRATHASAGTEAQYRKRLTREIAAMYADVRARILEVYRVEEPRVTRLERLAMDANPADILQRTVSDLKDKWLLRFAKLAPAMADWFAVDVDERSGYAMRQALRAGGFSVRFQKTPAMNDVLQSTIYQNVQLIRSIPEEFLGEVEGMVMRSVQAGRDLGQLSRDLQNQLGVAKRRAALIARDQNNKATSALNKVRQLENGIEEGIWLHSHAGKKPRPKHLAADGKRFKLAEGLPIGDKGQNVMPGEEINCRCSWKAIVPGFS